MTGIVIDQEYETAPQPLIDAARVLIFLKGYNAHDYKFSSAASA